MLFSPPNEFGKQFFYKLIGYSCAAHVSFLLVFFIAETWLGMQPLVVSLRTTGGRVSMVSRRTQPSKTRGRPQRRTASKRKPRRVARKKAPIKKATSKKVAPKKVAPKKAVPKKKAPLKKAATKVAKKTPMKKTVKKIPVKKAPPKGVVKKQPAKKVVKKTAPASKQKQSVKAVGSTAEPKEVHAAEAAWSSDAVEREFGMHLTIPAGFDDFEPFAITFDIANGKVVNIRPHKKGPLVMYTAVKDALLKSTMPKRSRKKIVWLITS